ncbi:MAG: metal-dependent hydrolase [Chloroflexota bacterium]|jgi:L-ascorbate metabolism protein UlaG (beta-lactamase superfamily)
MSENLGFRFTWYGHATVYVESEAGTTILIDPWFGHPRSPVGADAVERCDVMLVTHGHHDHIGAMPGEIASADSIAIARRTSPFWPAIHELSLWLGAQDTGAEIVGMNMGGAVDARGVRVSMVPAQHSAGDWLADDAVPLYLGDPVGFVVELENGRRFYHAGDTALFGDMRLIGEMHRPDVAFLPIGGHFTMDPPAAARAVELLGCATVVPIHYGTFPVLTGTPDQLREELEHLGLGDVTVLSPDPGTTIG